VSECFNSPHDCESRLFDQSLIRLSQDVAENGEDVSDLGEMGDRDVLAAIRSSSHCSSLNIGRKEGKEVEQSTESALSNNA
jgi:hypothetical protein